MQLVDPVSKQAFSVSRFSRFPTATLLAAWRTSLARKAARRLDWAVAADTYRSALRLDPNRGRAWVQFGNALGELGRPDSARIAYANATKVEPLLWLGYKHLGIVLRGAALHEEGLEALACALLLKPDDAELWQLATTVEDDHKVQSRIGAAGLTLADNRRSPTYIGFRAIMLRAGARKASRHREWSRAERLYRRLSAIRPQDAHVLIQLGHVLNEQNRQVEAEMAYRRATAADPLLPDGWLHLGYVLTAQGKHAMARQAFALVNNIAPARRATHPILATADGMTKAAERSNSRRLKVPKGLSRREQAIWFALAAHSERRG